MNADDEVRIATTLTPLQLQLRNRERRGTLTGATAGRDVALTSRTRGKERARCVGIRQGTAGRWWISEN